ncbi:hypothetical protein [Allomesorhizobium alhagi]|uniref:Uncharacterized protein n=1 Tax=Mesorhizobium alhagi CCNWXJ12-2 TaxID=1107882 RepID=H0HM94_9HYPH|nr:hypothetical protein [Mesorhizobium alhagi]EHK58154.1 hypothetical protein MAXJ12_06290 [Mesorhizobium alhagi CCNWXJ12-2]
MIDAWLFETAKGGRWHVTVDGEAILASSREPEHEACCVLARLGITGKIKFRHACGMAGMVMDIQRAAGLAVNEGPLRIVKQAPESRPDRPPAAVSPIWATSPHLTKQSTHTGSVAAFFNRERINDNERHRQAQQ